jgi:ubiquinol-cytochrome c reductase iron-sulfur subunit
MNRRQHLKWAVSTLTLIGAAITSIPFLRSLNVGAWRAKDFDLEIDISTLTTDKPIDIEWFGTPIRIVLRTSEDLKKLSNPSSNLLDPESLSSVQPTDAKNSFRSIKPEILVFVPLCTHLGCKVNQIEAGAKNMVLGWEGGFHCPCHGSNFDLAGRVHKGMPAPINLKIPPYKYTEEHKILFSLTLL